MDVSKDSIETKLNRKPKGAQKRKQNRTVRDVTDSTVYPMESSISGLKYEKYPDNEEEDEADDDDQQERSQIEKQDNQEIPIPPNSTVAVSYLTLKNVDHEHSGRYQCIATNRFGTTYSQRFKVTVACEYRLDNNFYLDFCFYLNGT